MKKFFTYPVFVVLFLSFISLLLFGSILRYHYLGGEKFKSLQKGALFFAEIIPTTVRIIKTKNININIPDKLTKHKKKNRFQTFSETDRNGILVLPRYDHSKNRSIVEIIDLVNFEIIHSYEHDVDELNYNIVKKNPNFKDIIKDSSALRFQYRDPLLFEDGSMIVNSDYAPLIKLDVCSNIIWINDEEKYHHSKEIDHEGNIWSPAILFDHTSFVEKYYRGEDFWEDAIIKIDKDGKVLFKKSLVEIFIENKIFNAHTPFPRLGNKDRDPIHLNDIQPANFSSDHWRKGDLFLSSRHLSSIIHYRPSTNKIINYITGPFSGQHDVDILSKNEISIFNNNNFLIENTNSEILIYNFQTKKFNKMFNDQLINENFKTHSQGLSHILYDGSLIVEEQNHGRLIMFNNKGQKEWEFVNKDQNGDIGFISWSRIIEDEKFIKNFKSMIKNKQCLN